MVMGHGDTGGPVSTRQGAAFGCGGRRGKGEALPPASGQEEDERSDVRRMACLRGAGTGGQVPGVGVLR